LEDFLASFSATFLSWAICLRRDFKSFFNKDKPDATCCTFASIVDKSASDETDLISSATGAFDSASIATGATSIGVGMGVGAGVTGAVVTSVFQGSSRTLQPFPHCHPVGRRRRRHQRHCRVVHEAEGVGHLQPRGKHCDNKR
jgi:hypothetical protein